MNRAVPGCCVVFALLAAGAAGAAPVVFHVSDPVLPDETALLFGDGIGPDVTALAQRLPDDRVQSPPGARREHQAGSTRLQVLQATDLAAKVLIPADWQPGEYQITLSAGGAASEPIYLNRTEPWWWIGGPGDTAQPGGEIQVFGKNLGPKTRAWLTSGNRSIALASASAEAYDASFPIPDSTPPGDYQLWVHNGFGGAEGFGSPLNVRVAALPAWPAKQYNVRKYGAAGDGSADDTAAFRNALADAGKAGGGVVYAPRGDYKITGKLTIPPHTILRGEKEQWVWLYVPRETPEFDTVLAGDGDFGVENLSLVSQTARRLIVCPDKPSEYTGTWGSSPPLDQLGHNVFLRHLRLQHLRYAHRLSPDSPLRSEQVGPSTVVLGGPDMEVSDCDVVSSGMPLVLQHAHHDQIRNNRLGTGRQGWYGIWDADQTVFSGNDISATDLEGSYGGVQGTAYRLYFAGNHWHDAYGDEREALTFDTPYGPTWMGKVASSRGAEITAADKTWTPHSLRGQVCFIANGRGLGQYIPISDNSDTTITLEHPWAVPPDNTSLLVVRVNKSEVVITNNTFSDNSASVQLYAQSYGFIMDGNTAERTGGMYGVAWDAIDRRRNTRRYSTCCFNQWINNNLSQGFVYQQGAFLYGILGPALQPGTVTDTPAITTIGNVIRGNTARDDFTVGALYFGSQSISPPTMPAGYFGRDTIIEHNSVTDGRLGLDVYPGYRDTLIRGNRVERCQVPLRDDGENTAIDPVERLLYQVHAVMAQLGDTVELESLESAADKLEKNQHTVEVKEQAEALRERLWKDVGQATGGSISPALLETISGLYSEVTTPPTTAGAAPAGTTIRLRSEPWSPVLSAQAGSAGPATTLQPNVPADLKGASPALLTVTLASVPLVVKQG